MERIAFISDIHSNFPALQSTLKDIKERGISRIYCLGDIIGYHSFPNEVIELIRKYHIICIKGNHDETITEQKFNRNLASDFVLYWNFDVLTKDNFIYLRHLPDSMEFNVEDVAIDLVHGSPDSISEYIREGSIEADKYLKSMDSDILLCAHTHIPYIIEKNGKYLLNTGSVGKPKFGKPESSYIILTINGSDIKPEIISLPYSVETIARHLKKNNFPQKLITALKTGRP